MHPVKNGEITAARAMRIFPALAVALGLTAFVLGPLLTALPPQDYAGAVETWTYVPRGLSLALRQPELPGVLQDVAYYPETNGSLWTLQYEVMCYAVVLMMGLARDQLAVVGHHAGHGPAELRHAGGDLCHLVLPVHLGIARIGAQPVDRPGSNLARCEDEVHGRLSSVGQGEQMPARSQDGWLMRWLRWPVDSSKWIPWIPKGIHPSQRADRVRF